MLNSTGMNEKVHIIFPLTPDESGYPPATSERMWATRISDGTFEIDNIPFFVRGISSGDKVVATMREGALFYESTKEYSGNSTLRVSISLDDGEELVTTVRNKLLSELKKLGCTAEVSHIPNLVAVEVPQSVPLESVIRYLEKGVAEKMWDYEEAALRQ